MAISLLLAIVSPVATQARTGLVVSTTCVEETGAKHGSAPDHAEQEPCGHCLLSTSAKHNTPIRIAGAATLAPFLAISALRWHETDRAPIPPLAGWSSSWSSRAPPAFS